MIKGFLCLKNPHPKSASNTNRPKFNKGLTATDPEDDMIIFFPNLNYLYIIIYKNINKIAKIKMKRVSLLSY